MTSETAFRAIDLLADSSKNKEDVAVTFYGGEPILQFPLIRSCVEYSLKKLRQKKHIAFSITTNGTLITQAMAEFFALHGFSLVVSIDGPKDVHDEHRADPSGKGSFDKSILGLKKLFDAYGPDYEKLSLSMVFAPPYSIEKMDKICQLWAEIKWLPKSIRVSITYPMGYIEKGNEPYEEERQFDTSLLSWVNKEFIDAYKNGNRSFPIAAHAVEKKLTQIFRRPIYEKSSDKFNLNACCIPGGRKLFVSASGELQICERILDSPVLGDVDNGINFEIIKRVYFDEYAKLSYTTCSKCWAGRLCNICYMHAYRNKRFDSEMKARNCESARHMVENSLKLYCSLLEINDKGLDYLEDYVIS